MIETAEVTFTNCHNTQLIINIGVPVLKVFKGGGFIKSNKPIYFTGDFNLNVLDYNKNEKVTKFSNLTYEKGLVPVINKPTKPTRVTKNTVTAVDHIITNSLLHITIRTVIIKLDVSDRFLKFLIAETEKRITPAGSTNYETFNKQKNYEQVSKCSTENDMGRCNRF